MNTSTTCPSGADDSFGPRVHDACRGFDFTLQFEDAFFHLLPAAVFFLLLPWRFVVLGKASLKLGSYKLAILKLALLAILFTLHLTFFVLQLQEPRIRTSFTLPAGTLSMAAIFAAGILSFLEDQRSPRPSDVLVLYFSASTILAIPRLRSFWSMSSLTAVKALWTAIFIVTIAVAAIESIRKSRFLRSVDKGLTREQTVGFWNRSLFIWVVPFFLVGYRNRLRLDDIPQPGKDLEAVHNWDRLNTHWTKATGRHRLLRATAAANFWSIVSAIIPRLAMTCFTFCQPFLIEAAVSNLQGRSDVNRAQYGRALVGAFVLVYTGIAVSRALFQRQVLRLLAKVRAGLISKIYRDTTSLRVIDLKDSAALTLMSTNVERSVETFSSTHTVWSSVVEIGVATWLLVHQMSAAAAVPVVICLIFVVGASRIANNFGPAQMAWIQGVQRRISVTSNMLSNMKTVKMLGLTSPLSTIVSKLRVDELKASERFRKLLTLQILTGNAPVLFAPFATFVVYAIIARFKKDEALLTAQAFTSLSLVSLITRPLLALCEALPSCVQAIACFTSIEEYCSKTPLDDSVVDNISTTVTTASNEVELSNQPAASPPTSLFTFKDVDIAWSGSESECVINDTTLSIAPGFTAIIGPVASGKSTLISSMLGETIVRKGTASRPLSGVAFCSQTPWIMDATVQSNITGDSEFDQKWYDFTVNSCCLQEDLQRLPLGDQTLCGSNGASLSGGQRQRVAFARAVYSRLPIVLLDDILSGLDAKTTATLISRFFSETGYFRKAGISVVFATHSQRVLPHMDSIVVLDAGRLADCGSYDEIKKRSKSLVDQALENPGASSQSDDQIEPAEASEPAKSQPELGKTDSNATADEDEKHRRSGNWSVYSYYARSAGFWSMVFWAVFTVIGAVLASYTAIWIQKWTEANQSEPNKNLGLYLGIYGLLVVLSTAGTAGECWTFFVHIINDTALTMHSDLLKATLRAPFEFFQQTDTGTITNRFSQDMDYIDMSLPTNAIQFTTGATSCAVQLIVICIVGKYLAAAIPAIIGCLYIVQKCYLYTSRQVRLIDIEARAPIFKLAIETLAGVSTIRAFKWTPAFRDRNAHVLDQSQRPFYMLGCIQQWLGLVLDLIVGGLAVVIIACATATTNAISAGSIGVALVLLLEFSGLLSQTMQAWTRLETSIGAVARVQQFVKTTPSESSPNTSTPAQWPSQGAIRFESVEASYGTQSKPVLKNITMSFEGGERIIFCGPSGSGKSSLIMAMLSMMRVNGGRIAIDDVDISTLSGDSVRQCLNIVPQDPFFIPGTVRFNLDMESKSSDDTIIAALERVGLWDKVRTNGGLDGELDSSEFSHGEKQLMCLARAMLVSSKILILDEATSSVDKHTEATMQDIIDSEFKNQTVISVLHRFDHVHRYDRVIVVRDGEVVESGTPNGLLGSDSLFAKLYHNSK